MDKIALGKKIKKLRNLHKLTQEGFAELIDMDIRQVSRIESGENYPSLTFFIKMCQVFNITPNEMLEYDKKDRTIELKSDIIDILSLVKEEQLVLIKKLVLAVL